MKDILVYANDKISNYQWNELLLTDRYYNLKVKIYLPTKYVKHKCTCSFCPMVNLDCAFGTMMPSWGKHGMPTALCSLLPEVQQMWSVRTVQVVLQLPQKVNWWEQVRIHENQNKKFNGFLRCLIININYLFGLDVSILWWLQIPHHMPSLCSQ